ncbi:hypothetical protein ACJJTC_011965 [Scirpophaga incertulas]
MKKKIRYQCHKNKALLSKQTSTSCHYNVDSKQQGSRTSDDNSEYNIPLERLRIKKNSKTPFQKLLPIPNYAVIKQKPRHAEEKWYCYACNEERYADMRNCPLCKRWFHEECLTKGDIDFECPMCN